MQDSEFYWMRLNNGKITTIKQTDRIQTSPIWPVVASGLKNLGESDVAESWPPYSGLPIVHNKI